MTFNDIMKYILGTASLIVPFVAYFIPSSINLLWALTLYAVFILMLIRPLADIFPSLKLYRFLPLRKYLGIFSATIVVSLGFIHYISPEFNFLETYFSLAYWSFEGNLFWAHIGELTGFILLITSNTFSQRILRRNWKRIQRLSYVYFFSGAWYVFATFHKSYAIIMMIIVFELTLFAFLKKRIKVEEPIITTA